MDQEVESCGGCRIRFFFVAAIEDFNADNGGVEFVSVGVSQRSSFPDAGSAAGKATLTVDRDGGLGALRPLGDERVERFGRGEFAISFGPVARESAARDGERCEDRSENHQAGDDLNQGHRQSVVQAHPALHGAWRWLRKWHRAELHF